MSDADERAAYDYYGGDEWNGEDENDEEPERTDAEADEALALNAAAVPMDVAMARVRGLVWELAS